jgi:hypothetical protein
MSGATPYGTLDRAMHRLGFGTLGLQRRLAGAETSMFRDRIDPAHARRPVFITSLPRAGTTVVLEALTRLPEFASATYRHMPFPLLPLLWTDASRRFRQRSALGERAHGDGLDVGFDSPEAFEEPLWMAFWPKHYRATGILPWEADERDPGFERAFRQHMAKVVAAATEGATRYLSKNNANIARLPLLDATFPDAAVVVPVRDPLSHTASLLRQHRRFVELHAEDGFARTYMEGLGHFEFGAALRPITFAGPADIAAADDPAFWLEYWCDAYEAVLRNAGRQAVFVSLDRLSGDPLRQIGELAAAIGAEADGDALRTAAEVFRPQGGRPVEKLALPSALVERARRLHRALLDRCIGAGEAAA